jgi:hypothetical protein
LGADDFTEVLVAKLGRSPKSYESSMVRDELDAVRAERLVREELKAEGWVDQDLQVTPKGHAVKVRIAARLRRETPMDARWIADRLSMGSAGYLRSLLWHQSDRR